MALDVRAAAARVIADVLGGHSLNQALPARLSKVRERDRGLLQQLCYGTLRHAPRLQGMLVQLLDKPLKDKDRDLQGLILCGLYQLDNTRVPDHAAVAATVSATKALKKDWARGMTNAVLRRYLREREQLTQTLEPAARNSHPRWLFNEIQQQWPVDADSIVAANNQQPPMTLRLNTRQMKREDYLTTLEAAGIAARPGNISPYAIQLSKPVDVLELPGFATGNVSVQDEAAQVAAILLQGAAGERILDACAAPGGKSCHILECQPQLAELVTMDVDELRLVKVSENLTRLGLHATVLVGDAAAPPPVLKHASFDRILVDAPCSASGVIRRHPDVKLLRRPADIDNFAEQQLAILKGLWPLLKPGGTLLYVTCSILNEENSQVVQRFLALGEDAELETVEVDWGEPVASGRQLLPGPDGPDGLFYARLHKTP
jgi:16S rRNA (cytosine967-C5)-methyltransferase